MALQRKKLNALDFGSRLVPLKQQRPSAVGMSIMSITSFTSCPAATAPRAGSPHVVLQVDALTLQLNATCSATGVTLPLLCSSVAPLAVDFQSSLCLSHPGRVSYLHLRLVEGL
mmetsp:Transcript_3373/g.7960  ORF Transcript_3373/g.7960 Transcript_3373/m.7960 type:complete len:114 (-) Transcript_3373:681-1022(-)